MRSKCTGTSLFFAHVMKSGGTSVFDLLSRHLGDRREEPPDFGERLERYMNPSWLRQLAPGDDRDRLVAGHFGARAQALLPFPSTAVTMLRHPVDRTISYLRHSQRHHAEHHGLPLEQIYEDEWHFSRMIDNHQVKVFSLTEQEATTPCFDGELASITGPRVLERLRSGAPTDDLPAAELLDAAERLRTAPNRGRHLIQLTGAPIARHVVIDEARFDAARAALEGFDIVGVSDRSEELEATLADRFGWPMLGLGRLNASAPGPVPLALRRRITADNEADLELYRLASRRSRREQRRHLVHLGA